MKPLKYFYFVLCRSFQFLSLFIFFTIFISCTSTTKINLIKSKGVKKVYLDGQEAIISKKRNSQVSLLVSEARIKDGKRLQVLMHFTNLSDEPINLNPNRIRVLRLSKKDSINVLSYDDLIEEVNKNKRRYAISSIIMSALIPFAEEIANSTYSGSGISARSGSYSTSYGTGNYEEISYNSTLALIETDIRNKQRDREMTKYNEQRNRDLASYDRQSLNLKHTILKKNTVMPGQSISGYVVVPMPELEKSKDFFWVFVKFGTDKHNFFIKQSLIF